MAKHPTSSRVQRDDGLPDDIFVTTVKRFTQWARDNRRQATTGAAALIVILGAGAWYIAQQRSLEANAATRLSQVQQSVASGNTQLAIRDLQSFLDTFGSTDVANQARLTLADILIGEERHEEAIEALGRLPQRLGEPFGLPAARLEATALEQLERFDDAVDAYLAIAQDARFPFQRREALADAARVSLQNGNVAAAVDILQQLVDTFEDDEQGRAYYEMWLAEAQARAGQGATAAAGDEG